MKKLTALGAVLFLLSALFSAQKAQDKALVEQSIKTINQEIIAHGLEWRAKMTSLSLLPSDQQRLRLGARLPERGSVNPSPQITRSIPTTLDWRNHNGQNWNSPIRNQGDCGSCWAFGTIASMESIYKIEQNLPEHNLDLSEQHLLSCSNAGDCVAGGYAWGASEYARSSGVPTEGCFPYTADDDPCSPCTNWSRNVARLTGSEWVSTDTTDNPAIMTALQESPVIGWFNVYSDFYHYSSGIYEKTSSATLEGGHIILIVGYNQAQRYWICKNSWASTWGEQGYFRIRWDQVGIGQWVIKNWGVTINNRPPVLSSIGNKTIKEGQALDFLVSAQDEDKDQVTLSVTNLPAGAVFTPGSGQFTWTPDFTQSASYQLTFRASDGKATDSERIVITVINIKKGNGRI